MSLAIFGINHKTAPLALREKVAFSPETIGQARYQLFQHPLINGCVILSTCNRTELYISFEYSSDITHIRKSVEQWLYLYQDIDKTLYQDCFYWFAEQDAIEHLMKVACGVDSQVIGEPQILGQTKQAYKESQIQKVISVELNKVFQRAFHVAKRVRTETHIGADTASVAYSACLVARNIFPVSEDLNVMLVGAGETITLIARYLKQHNFNKIIIANRTRENALILAHHIDAEIIALPEIATRLKDVDIVISSTASPLPIIGKGMVERSLQARNQRKMLFIDIAVPRDIEPEIGNLDHVHLYTVDDLQNIVDQNLERRSMAAKEAEYIIEQEAKLFMQWLSSRKAVELIKTYRKKALKQKTELENLAIHAIQQGENIDDVIRRLSHKLTNRLIHSPTQSLLHAASHDCDCLKIISESLGLKDP